jgi:iron complex transport system substrate-binding protein
MELEVATALDGGVTRRTVLGVAAGLVASAALGGGAAAQQASPAAGTRIVETIHGPIEVPANPQRVVTINYIVSIAAAELGVIPVGVTRWVPELPAGFPDLSKVARIENESYELDIEAVIALQPDLILGADVLTVADQGVPYEQLSRIAPTAIFEWTSGGANWEAQAVGCANALGKTAEFEALRAAYEEKTAAIKTTYADLLAALTVDFVDANENEWYLHGPASTHCKVAIEAGISLGAGAEQEETFTGFSFERLDMLAGTGALVLRADLEPSSVEILSELPTFTALPAVAAGRVLPSTYFYVASYAQCDALLTELEGGLKTLSGA